MDFMYALRSIERRFGADRDTGQFVCPLPSHAGQAAVRHYLDRGPMVWCQCRGGDRWTTLGEVRASIAYGNVRPRSDVELAAWTRILGFEHGVFEPLPVEVPRLPDHASPEAVQVREWFVLHIGLKWADGERVAVPFSVQFIRALAQQKLSQRKAYAGLRELLREEVIHKWGEIPSGMPHPTFLYLPGPAR